MEQILHTFLMPFFYPLLSLCCLHIYAPLVSINVCGLTEAAGYTNLYPHLMSAHMLHLLVLLDEKWKCTLAKLSLPLLQGYAYRSPANYLTQQK